MAVAVAAVASCRRSSDNPGIKKKAFAILSARRSLKFGGRLFFVMSAGEVPKIEIVLHFVCNSTSSV